MDKTLSKVNIKGEILNKSELIDIVTEKTSLKKQDIINTVDTVFEIIKESLSCGKKVRLMPFGSFAVKEKQSGKIRNPRTGEKVKMPAQKIAIFHPGKALQEAIKEEDKKYTVELENKEYIVILHPDPVDGGYWIDCPELDCSSQGDTIEEALEMIKDSIEGHMEVQKKYPELK